MNDDAVITEIDIDAPPEHVFRALTDSAELAMWWGEEPTVELKANWHEHPEVPTTVRWDLERTKTGTRVRVTHSGLTNEPASRKDYAGGWVGVLELLRKFVGR